MRTQQLVGLSVGDNGDSFAKKIMLRNKIRKDRKLLAYLVKQFFFGFLFSHVSLNLLIYDYKN